MVAQITKAARLREKAATAVVKVSIMNNALLKMKTQLRFLDYNSTENSNKSRRREGKEEDHLPDGRLKL
jgi:hypothetical protein